VTIMDFADQAKKLLDPIAALVTICGLPFAIAAFRQSTKKEQLDREYGTYNSLDEKYVEFLSLSINHPELDIFETPMDRPPELSPSQIIQQLAGFNILFSIFERAYLMYKGERNEVRERQWAGWQDSIGRYTGRANFKNAWKVCGNGFDTDFQRFLQNQYGLQPPDPSSTPSH
jgi:hypothetical protein